MSFVANDAHSVQQDLNRLELSFMYTRLFKEVLLEMQHPPTAMSTLVTFSQEKYADNATELMMIDEFKRDYRAASSIWWYTRECFVYQMLNRALRTLEGETIITMGFLMCDLHRQLERLHEEQFKNTQQQRLTVYRGQSLSLIDFEKLSKSRAGLMSFNNFLSTSYVRKVSLAFAQSASQRPGMVGVLFKITIDLTIVASTPFARIDQESYFKAEAELLFSMHSIFRVVDITPMNDK